MSAKRITWGGKIGPYKIKIYKLPEREKKLKHLGSGLAADVFLVNNGGVKYAKKVFNPSPMARFFYALLYQSKHPYLKSEAMHAAFWRRRIASRLSVLAGKKAYIVDAFAECDGGFYSPFIKGRVPTYEEALRMRAFLHPLEQEFHLAGMPVWSFGETLNWRWRENVLIDDKGNLAIPDYEAGLPSPHPLFLIHFDDINMPRLKRYLAEHKTAVSDLLGKTRSRELDEALENYHFHEMIWKFYENPFILRAARGFTDMIRRTAFWGLWKRHRWDDLCELCRRGTIVPTDRGIILIDDDGRRLALTKSQKLGVMEVLDRSLIESDAPARLKELILKGLSLS
jgi:hypothetical protein